MPTFKVKAYRRTEAGVIYLPEHEVALVFADLANMPDDLLVEFDKGFEPADSAAKAMAESQVELVLRKRGMIPGGEE